MERKYCEDGERSTNIVAESGGLRVSALLLSAEALLPPHECADFRLTRGSFLTEAGFTRLLGTAFFRLTEANAWRYTEKGRWRS
jgi:hypothetical protein